MEKITFTMTSDADAATYAEITVVSRETFKMVGNECYANARLQVRVKLMLKW